MITLSQNDHPAARIGNCWDKGAKPYTESGLVSQQADPLLGQSSTSNCHTEKTLKVGDRCHYIGDNWQRIRICGRKQLTIEAIDSDMATVNHQKWAFTQSVPLSELALAK